MRISLNWVREFCPFRASDSPRRLGERFSLATAEVEGVEAIGGEGLAPFVAAKLLIVEPVPKSKKLSRCEVDAGKGRRLQIVCGAPNARAGMVAPLALAGTTVQGKTLGEAKLAGVLSQGMLLSEAELGISEDHSGLLELPADLAPGTPMDVALADRADVILEIDNKSLTHRPDLWGHYGLAREFATIYETPLKPYPVEEALARAGGAAGIRVEIEAGEARRRCRRYCGLRLDGVRVALSPDWLSRRLRAVGSRPINNLVDVTNYVLLELGQPLHAFDATRLRGDRVLVRMPRSGERMRLLNGQDIALGPEDLLIADGEGPVALAGVMGGDGSQIGEGTSSIFLESAGFEAAGVRRSSLRHGRSDASARFEKSLDPEQARSGILRAARLILDLCPGARLAGDLIDVGFTPPPPIEIRTGPREISSRLGAELPEGQVRGILERLGFGIEDERGAAAVDGGPRWRVRVPSWRATRDISIAEDLVEEVGRIHGYDHIAAYAPQWPVEPPPANPRRIFERRAKELLVELGGLYEVFTYALVGEALCRRFGLDPDAQLKLRNPLSEDMDRLRRELVPQLIEKAAENQRFLERFGFFELGRVYLKDKARLRAPELPRENVRLAGIICGSARDDRGFYRLRKLVLELCAGLELAAPLVGAHPEPPAWAHPAACAGLTLDGAAAGGFYRLHPATLAARGLSGEVLAFDLDLDALFAAPRRVVRYRSLPRFPDVPFDVAVVAPERTPAARLEDIIRRAGGESLRSLEVFDVYRGKGIPEAHKSIALRMVFRSDEATLDSATVERLQKAVIRALEENGFPLRT